MGTVLDQFDEWKKFLKARVDQAKTMGLTTETINNLAYEIGSFLDERVDPKNEQQRAIKELWDAGDEQERHTIAKLMVKLSEKS